MRVLVPMRVPATREFNYLTRRKPTGRCYSRLCNGRNTGVPPGSRMVPALTFRNQGAFTTGCVSIGSPPQTPVRCLLLHRIGIRHWPVCTPSRRPGLPPPVSRLQSHKPSAIGVKGISSTLVIAMIMEIRCVQVLSSDTVVHCAGMPNPNTIIRQTTN